MASLVERTVATDRVAGIIQLVRRRWRLRHVLFGLGVVLALTVATLWVAAMAMERAGFSDVVVYGDHTEAEATSDNDFLVYVAAKPPGASS